MTTNARTTNLTPTASDVRKPSPATQKVLIVNGTNDVLGLLEAEPTLLGHGVPDDDVKAAWGIRRALRRSVARTRKGADDGARPHPCAQRVVPRPAVEQRRRRLAQSLLVGREVEVHGGEVYGHH